MPLSAVAGKALLLPFTQRRAVSFAEACERKWQLSPAETLVAPPAIFDPVDLERVSAVMADTSFEQEQKRIRGGRVQHDACTAYLLNRVTILNGHLYCGPLHHRLLSQKSKPWGPPRIEFSNATLASTLYGSRYFGHWMADDLTLALAVRDLGEAVAVKRGKYIHEDGYSSLFGIRPVTLQHAHCENLVVLEDVGQGSFKRARYRLLQSQMHGFPAHGRNSKIFIRRGSSGSRRQLENQDEIEVHLSRQKFEIVDPEVLSATEIVEKLIGAEVVVGVEGSHLAHALYTMRSGGVVCALQPPYRFNNLFKDYTDCIGMRYGFVVGEATLSGFRVSLNSVNHLLDRCKIS